MAATIVRNRNIISAAAGSRSDRWRDRARRDAPATMRDLSGSPTGVRRSTPRRVATETTVRQYDAVTWRADRLRSWARCCVPWAETWSCYRGGRSTGGADALGSVRRLSATPGPPIRPGTSTAIEAEPPPGGLSGEDRPCRLHEVEAEARGICPQTCTSRRRCSADAGAPSSATRTGGSSCRRRRPGRTGVMLTPYQSDVDLGAGGGSRGVGVRGPIAILRAGDVRGVVRGRPVRLIARMVRLGLSVRGEDDTPT
jgi:hypothetical protein